MILHNIQIRLWYLSSFHNYDFCSFKKLDIHSMTSPSKFRVWDKNRSSRLRSCQCDWKPSVTIQKDPLLSENSNIFHLLNVQLTCTLVQLNLFLWAIVKVGALFIVLHWSTSFRNKYHFTVLTDPGRSSWSCICRAEFSPKLAARISLHFGNYRQIPSASVIFIALSQFGLPGMVGLRSGCVWAEKR